MIRLILLSTLFILPLLLFGCKEDETPSVAKGGCVQCHSMELDANHQMVCTVCHQGNDTASEKIEAHTALISQPAHPAYMHKTCGSCHQQESDASSHAVHFTLSNSINLMRRAFGATTDLTSLTEIPVEHSPENGLALADDLLRRRCLRCHLYFKGDEYPATRHGTGCSACHLQYTDGRLVRHTFRKGPDDEQCLSCHYGNRVGFDYYGRFEHDFNEEYRTPYTTKNDHFRPYGVEYHQLTSDIHQQRGLSCIDCHGGNELMHLQTAPPPPSCAGCHDAGKLQQSLPPRVQQNNGIYVLVTAAEGKNHPLPLMQHPAHERYGSQVTCQVCHAQWSFNDTGKHLLRSDLDEYDEWSRLTTQGSSEIEQLLLNNLDFSQEELPPATSDKITGDIRPGVWYKGFEMRRWEGRLLGRNRDGRITVVRPALDYALSWIDEEETVHFDSHDSQAPDNGLLPYTPHTTGPAGIFYEQRIRDFILSDPPSVQPVPVTTPTQ